MGLPWQPVCSGIKSLHSSTRWPAAFSCYTDLQGGDGSAALLWQVNRPHSCVHHMWRSRMCRCLCTGHLHICILTLSPCWSLLVVDLDRFSDQEPERHNIKEAFDIKTFGLSIDCDAVTGVTFCHDMDFAEPSLPSYNMQVLFAHTLEWEILTLRPWH